MWALLLCLSLYLAYYSRKKRLQAQRRNGPRGTVHSTSMHPGECCFVAQKYLCWCAQGQTCSMFEPLHAKCTASANFTAIGEFVAHLTCNIQTSTPSHILAASVHPSRNEVACDEQCASSVEPLGVWLVSAHVCRGCGRASDL